MNINLNANSVGERIVLAIAVMAMCWEIVSDNTVGCHRAPVAEPITVDACAGLCWHQDRLVKRWESYACECGDLVEVSE
jgi:hypothetical protein